MYSIYGVRQSGGFFLHVYKVLMFECLRSVDGAMALVIFSCESIVVIPGHSMVSFFMVN